MSDLDAYDLDAYRELGRRDAEAKLAAEAAKAKRAAEIAAWSEAHEARLAEAAGTAPPAMVKPAPPAVVEPAPEPVDIRALAASIRNGTTDRDPVIRDIARNIR